VIKPLPGGWRRCLRQVATERSRSSRPGSRSDAAGRLGVAARLARPTRRRTRRDPQAPGKVVIRQEAQLNVGASDTSGSEPEVGAIAIHDARHLNVVGEVKGIWPDEYETAIETQLADRYLSRTRTSTGIYIVAHFSSDRWNPDDCRRNVARSRERDALIRKLNDEATRLSVDGNTIHVRVVAVDL